MNKDEIMQYAEDTLVASQDISNMLKSEGWKIYRRILDDTTKDCIDLNNIKTIKELEGSKLALRIINSTIDKLKGIESEGAVASDMIKKIEGK
jgi:hypothetical protein